MSDPGREEIDYTDGAGDAPADYGPLDAKIENAIEVLRRGLSAYDTPVVLWTGGKDSTLALYLVVEVADEYGFDRPPAVVIDHFQHFDVTHEFVERWAERWDVDIVYARNEDVGEYVETHRVEPGDGIPVGELDEHNRFHVRELLEYEEDTFPFLLDTYVGNHLLKTVALNDTLDEHDADGVITGVRWDEQDARAEETFFSSRRDSPGTPPHDRIHPILPFTERDVWDALWLYVVPDTVAGFPDDGYIPESADDLPDGVEWTDVPISPKYVAGYRSIGAASTTERTGDAPAWRQDLAATTERAGRAQDKEDLMEQLRDLGYM